MKVHESPDGLLRKCSASAGNCKFKKPPEEHYELSQDQVNTANEKRLGKQYGEVATLTKGGEKEKKASLLNATPEELKEKFDLPEDTRVEVIGNFIVTDSSSRLVKERKLLKRELAKDLTPSEAEIQSNDLEIWSNKLYHPRQILIRNESGEVIGATVYENSKGQIAIHNVRVSSSERSKGAGLAMMESLKNKAKKDNKRLTVYNMLQTARTFYERAGAQLHDHSAAADFKLD